MFFAPLIGAAMRTLCVPEMLRSVDATQTSVHGPPGGATQNHPAAPLCWRLPRRTACRQLPYRALLLGLPCGRDAPQEAACGLQLGRPDDGARPVAVLAPAASATALRTLGCWAVRTAPGALLAGRVGSVDQVGQLLAVLGRSRAVSGPGRGRRYADAQNPGSA